jgi:hypothetical protein
MSIFLKFYSPGIRIEFVFGHVKRMWTSLNVIFWIEIGFIFIF